MPRYATPMVSLSLPESTTFVADQTRFLDETRNQVMAFCKVCLTAEQFQAKLRFHDFVPSIHARPLTVQTEADIAPAYIIILKNVRHLLQDTIQCLGSCHISALFKRISMWHHVSNWEFISSTTSPPIATQNLMMLQTLLPKIDTELTDPSWTLLLKVGSVQYQFIQQDSRIRWRQLVKEKEKIIKGLIFSLQSLYHELGMYSFMTSKIFDIFKGLERPGAIEGSVLVYTQEDLDYEKLCMGDHTMDNSIAGSSAAPLPSHSEGTLSTPMYASPMATSSMYASPTSSATPNSMHDDPLDGLHSPNPPLQEPADISLPYQGLGNNSHTHPYKSNQTSQGPSSRTRPNGPCETPLDPDITQTPSNLADLVNSHTPPFALNQPAFPEPPQVNSRKRAYSAIGDGEASCAAGKRPQEAREDMDWERQAEMQWQVGQFAGEEDQRRSIEGLEFDQEVSRLYEWRAQNQNESHFLH